MSAKPEEKQVYETIIFRTDGQHISALQSINFDEAVEKWKELNSSWEESISNKKPFKIMKPIVTSFDPGLISEIAVRPLIKVSESKYDNPYQQEMMKKGLSGMLRQSGHPVNSGMLDEGYT